MRELLRTGTGAVLVMMGNFSPIVGVNPESVACSVLPVSVTAPPPVTLSWLKPLAGAPPLMIAS